MVDLLGQKDGAIFIPNEEYPIFTHEVMNMKSKTTKDQIPVIIDDLKEHEEFYLSLGLHREINVHSRVFSILSPIKHQSALGIVAELSVLDKTFRYVIKVLMGSVKSLLAVEFIMIVNNKGEVLAGIPLEQFMKDQLARDLVNICNMDSSFVKEE